MKMHLYMIVYYIALQAEQLNFNYFFGHINISNCTKLQLFAQFFRLMQVISIHLHLVILQMLLYKATYNCGIHKAINLEEANRQRKYQVSGIVQISTS